MDWGLSHGNYIFGKIDRSRRNMEIYKGKWMVLGALGCINNADVEKKNSKGKGYKNEPNLFIIIIIINCWFSNCAL